MAKREFWEGEDGHRCGRAGDGDEEQIVRLIDSHAVYLAVAKAGVSERLLFLPHEGELPHFDECVLFGGDEQECIGWVGRLPKGK